MMRVGWPGCAIDAIALARPSIKFDAVLGQRRAPAPVTVLPLHTGPMRRPQGLSRA
jgi:hypothetical protein